MRARRANWERKLRSAGESLARWKSSRIDTDNFIPYIYTLCKIHMRNTTAKMNANLLLKEWKLRKRIPSGASLGCEFSVAELLRDEGRGAGTGKRPTFAKSAKMGASALCLAPWKSEISPGRLATCRPRELTSEIRPACPLFHSWVTSLRCPCASRDGYSTRNDVYPSTNP
jgi:hypothetical protein